MNKKVRGIGWPLPVVHPSKKDEKKSASQKIPRPAIHSVLGGWNHGTQLVRNQATD